jgi:hypothetical protein
MYITPKPHPICLEDVFRGYLKEDWTSVNQRYLGGAPSTKAHNSLELFLELAFETDGPAPPLPLDGHLCFATTFSLRLRRNTLRWIVST